MHHQVSNHAYTKKDHNQVLSMELISQYHPTPKYEN